MINWLLRGWVLMMLALRYRIRVRGLDEVAARGTRSRPGLLFLPNHPALIDPIILVATLSKRTAPRVLADRNQIDRFFIRWLARRFNVKPIPDLATEGRGSSSAVRAALNDCIADLQAGRNVMVYPAGGLMRRRYEDLGGNSAVQTILREAPGARVILVRTRGLWGSSFGKASGRELNLSVILRKAGRSLLLGGLFFGPRRTVTIELLEPADLPRQSDRFTINRYLESFYNAAAPPNYYVPYTWWERQRRGPRPEPASHQLQHSAAEVPAATRQLVVDYLRQLAGRETIRDEDQLARDLGLDSLSRVELATWLESEFGCRLPGPDAVETVADALMAACGGAVFSRPSALKPVPAAWFDNEPRAGPAGESSPPPAARLRLRPNLQTICQAFLEQARRTPGAVIVADQSSGAKTYRDLVTAVLVLRPLIARLPGDYVGIMLPASVAATTVYLATVFAGKVPVMVNWTTGLGQMRQALDLLKVQRVLTAEALVTRLRSDGLDLGELGSRFVFLERLGRGIPVLAKLRAAAMSRLSWRSLRQARPAAVAAVLFTSGSENLPKAVPLTHENILANVRDLAASATLRPDDRMIGLLPPFHSFGLTVTAVLPLLIGLRTVYHPNPTEAPALAQMIAAYRATVLLGTPTFLGGIARAAEEGQLESLRLAVTGAERCPPAVYELLAGRCPRALVLEGYGVTEGSPVVALNDEDAPQRETIGRVLPSLEHRVVDVETGQPVAPGRSGMLLVRGPSIFGGYLNYAGPSPFVELEGRSWYRTGDLVSELPDGVLTFRGRLKRFVKLGGEMVSLPAIEAALEPHYSAGVGGPAGAGGASGEPGTNVGPTLAVESTADEAHPELVLFTTRDLRREEVNRHIAQAGLSPLHNIRRIVRLDTIPVLGTGKVDYRALRERLSS